MTDRWKERGDAYDAYAVALTDGEIARNLGDTKTRARAVLRAHEASNKFSFTISEINQAISYSEYYADSEQPPER